MEDKKAIGIDIGFDYSCAGIFRNGRVEIAPNDGSRTITPSFVTFTENEILIGNTSLNMRDRYPENTIYGITKLIGRKYNDYEVQEFIKNVPYKIEKDLNSDRPIIIIKNMEQTNKYYPEDIYLFLLQRLKKFGSDLYGEDINNIIISVPSDFNKQQKEIIKKTAENKGLNISKIIYKSTAASISYFGKNLNNKKNVLIYSMDSCYSNITILTIENNIFTTLVSNNYNLGKEDFITKLVEYCISEFKEKTNINLNLNKFHKAIKILRRECENGIIQLNYSKEISIDIDSLADE